VAATNKSKLPECKQVGIADSDFLTSACFRRDTPTAIAHQQSNSTLLPPLPCPRQNRSNSIPAYSSLEWIFDLLSKGKPTATRPVKLA
jgi:hypothetical protein